MTPQPMIELQDLGKSWDGGKTHTIRHMNLSIATGEVIAILGESGCGKTTTLKMINRLIEPTEGRVLIGGENVLEQDAVELRRRVGFVFQHFGLFPHLTIAENMDLVLEIRGQKRGANHSRIESALARVKLDPAQFARRYPHELSGGQKQRVGFARALLVEPRVLLMDEPFGALDPTTRDGLQQELLQIQKEMNLTCVIVTHDMAEALIVADRIAIMDAGKIVALQTPVELLRQQDHPAVARYLQAPLQQARLVQELLQKAEG
ncbi:MAG: ATP-binding cassette domain-containing protein [Candidatus Sumerlaeia bacterium]|nr:ATP-binding cassette domain-containing protein [Candidatus Sumerlaeia bacterium]